MVYLLFAFPKKRCSYINLRTFNSCHITLYQPFHLVLKSANTAVKNLFTICSKLKLLYKRKTHAPRYYTTDSVLTQTLFSGNRSHKLNNNFDITVTTIKYILSTKRFDGVYTYIYGVYVYGVYIHIYIIYTIYNI